MPKFRRATPPITEVISAPLLHFKTIFDSPLKKIVRGTQVPGKGAASKTWSFYSVCKNLGAQHPLGAKIWLPKKSIWVGTIPHRDLQGYWTKLHRTCFASRGKNFCRSSNSPILNIRSEDICSRTLKSTEIGPNVACLSALKRFWGVPPEILNQHYKIPPSSDHRAKFRADRPTHLGDLALNKKFVAKHKQPKNLGQSPT